MQETLVFEGCRARVFGATDARTIIYLPTGGMEAEELLGLIPAEATLVTLDQTDWNRDFSPWPAPAVFRDGDFSGGAPAFLRLLTETIIPAVEGRIGQPQRRILAGYSLAGLFAVWAVMNTDLFDAAASMSGSLWFDGFMDYAAAHLADSPIRALYLSVGDRESRTKNPRMRRVEDCTRQMCALAEEAGIRTTFELNPGNHFVDGPQRIAKGIRWVLEQ